MLAAGAELTEYAREAIDALGDQHGGEQGEAVWALGQALKLQGDQVGALDAYRRSVDLLIALVVRLLPTLLLEPEAAYPRS